MDEMMDELKMNQMADDIHLIAAPFRLVGEWLKILAFILVLPVVFLISFVYWMLTGTPIMSRDECWLAQRVLTVLAPFILGFLHLFYAHIRNAKRHEDASTVAGMWTWIVGGIIAMPFVAKAVYQDGSYYNSTSTFVTLLPLSIMLAVFTVAVASEFMGANDRFWKEYAQPKTAPAPVDLDSLPMGVCGHCHKDGDEDRDTAISQPERGLCGADIDRIPNGWATIAKYHEPNCPWVLLKGYAIHPNNRAA